MKTVQKITFLLSFILLPLLQVRGTDRLIDPPVIQAHKTSIKAGEMVALYAEGCSSGVVKWSDGQIGRMIVAVPESNVTYSAVCKQGGTTSSSSNSVFITVTHQFLISEMEYFFDTDPGHGLGKSLPVSSGYDISETLNITMPTPHLSQGFHSLFVRAKNSNGKWSLATEKQVFVIGNGVGKTEQISAVEYYFNQDPGFGMGNQVSYITNLDNNFQFPIDVSSLPAGGQILYIRVKDNTGKWSLTQVVPFLIMPIIPNSVINKIEYFVDIDDPGKGAGVDVPVIPGEDIYANFSLNISPYSVGDHTLYIRVRDDDGLWSPTYAVGFNRPENICNQNATIHFAITKGDESYKASESITADNQIIGGTTKVHYGADAILLLPGFEVSQGTVFKADTEGCN